MNVQIAEPPLHESVERAASPERARSAQPTLWFLLLFAVALIPVGLSLHTVSSARAIEPPTIEAFPYGYTISLLMFVVPLVVLSVWAWRRGLTGVERRASFLALSAMILLGFFLEWSLGASCFTFPNPRAVVGLRIPVVGGSSPIEEFLFFALGPPATLLGYLWADRDWMPAYNVPIDPEADRRPTVSLNPAFTAVAALLMLAVLAARSAAGIPGIPLYFIYLFIIPSSAGALLLKRAARVVNWRALSLITALLLLVSVVWEANLGVPYGWWGYKSAAMLGVFIGPWSGLPIEEPFLWFVTAFIVVVWYEAARLRLASAPRNTHG